jgi:LmbE family N-acetylglucosaminyl deacetylase
MTARPEFLKNSLVIGAHPDDELLWFNSILRDVDEVMIVYCDFWAHPGLGAARRAAIADYPRGNVHCLAIPESGAYGCADWSDPVLTRFGIGFSVEANRREVTRLARKSLSAVQAIDPRRVATESVARAYETNFHALCATLEPRLRPDMNVFTHNPWGEYGHEEHIQVFQALNHLRDKIGFRLWMSNYCTERALPLAMRYFANAPGDYIRLPTDKGFAQQVADVYREHGCWTWADDWAWFDEECFMEAPRTASDAIAHRHLFPLNFFSIQPAKPRRWLPIALTMSAASAALTAASLSDF